MVPLLMYIYIYIKRIHNRIIVVLILSKLKLKKIELYHIIFKT
jgi:hypothetical protein